MGSPQENLAATAVLREAERLPERGERQLCSDGERQALRTHGLEERLVGRPEHLAAFDEKDPRGSLRRRRDVLPLPERPCLAQKSPQEVRLDSASHSTDSYHAACRRRQGQRRAEDWFRR